MFIYSALPQLGRPRPLKHGWVIGNLRPPENSRHPAANYGSVIFGTPNFAPRIIMLKSGTMCATTPCGPDLLPSQTAGRSKAKSTPCTGTTKSGKTRGPDGAGPSPNTRLGRDDLCVVRHTMPNRHPTAWTRRSWSFPKHTPREGRSPYRPPRHHPNAILPRGPDGAGPSPEHTLREGRSPYRPPRHHPNAILPRGPDGAGPSPEHTLREGRPPCRPPRHGQGTGTGESFQISSAYSLMVRSLENLPTLAVLRIAILAQRF